MTDLRFVFQSGALVVGESASPFDLAIPGAPERVTRVVTGKIHGALAHRRVMFDAFTGDPDQAAAAEALRRWADQNGVRLELPWFDPPPEGEVAGYSCRICGADVIGWVCADRGLRGSCGYITCPICADGSGGSTTRADEFAPCRHFVAAFDDSGLQLAGFEPAGDLPALAQGADFSETAITRAFGSEAELARRCYAGGWARPGSLAVLSSAVAERVGGHTLQSLTGGGLMATAWQDIFVPDPPSYVMRLERALERVRAGVERLNSAADGA